MVTSTTLLQKLKVAPKAKDNGDLIVSVLRGDEFCLDRRHELTISGSIPAQSVRRKMV
jgi:hypothetical protein